MNKGACSKQGSLQVKEPSPTSMFFDEISDYWAEIADARPTEKQVSFIRKTVKPFGLILDLSCGDGRHSIPLAESGYEIVGLDVSSRLLTLAKRSANEKDVKVELIHADMQNMPFRPGAFAAVLSLDTSFGYFPSEDQAQHVLTEVSKILVEGGSFVVDVFNREPLLRKYRINFKVEAMPLLRVLRRFPSFGHLLKWCEYPSFYMIQQRTVIENGRKLRDNWVFRDKKTEKVTFVQHVVWLYSLLRLERLLKGAGLRIGGVYGSYEGEKYTDHSSRLIVLSSKGADTRTGGKSR
jgi:ubiquinone/menaquinone biosynthesis C-methylase UbiE